MPSGGVHPITHCGRFPHDTGWTAVDPGRAKTRAFNLLVESSSQFGQSGNQKCWRRLSEEGNRETGSTLSRLAHIFTRPGPIRDISSSRRPDRPRLFVAAGERKEFDVELRHT